MERVLALVVVFVVLWLVVALVLLLEDSATRFATGLGVSAVIVGAIFTAAGLVVAFGWAVLTLIG